jgi:hypothetical protein
MTGIIPAIDMWAPIVPARDVMAYVADHFPPPQLGYLRVFWKGEATLETFRALAHSIACDDADVIAGLDAAHITRTLITGFDEATTGGTAFVTNDVVAAVAERHPDRFIPFAGADIMRGADAVREVEHWVRARGFRGLSLRPFMINLPADDRHYYPFYEKCVELDVPISIHASANWTTSRPSDLGHPRHFTCGLRFPRSSAHPQPRRPPVGARSPPAGLEAPGTCTRACRAPPGTSRRPAPGGSPCSASGRRRSRTRSSTGRAPSCSAADLRSSSRRCARCRSSARSWRSGSTGTRRG